MGLFIIISGVRCSPYNPVAIIFVTLYSPGSFSAFFILSFLFDLEVSGWSLLILLFGFDLLFSAGFGTASDFFGFPLLFDYAGLAFFLL